jgi:hypothetical protein
MSQNLAELAETAITAMKALNTELKRQQSDGQCHATASTLLAMVYHSATTR